ncbi:MAG: hypothetical protein K8R35_04990 [Bacteroidales bacterium]|nr:hypothetical protein [Bacteroidales bacterium]
MKNQNKSNPFFKEDIFIDVLGYVYRKGVDGTTYKSLYLEHLCGVGVFTKEEERIFHPIHKEASRMNGSEAEFLKGLGAEKFDSYGKENIQILGNKIRSINNYFESITEPIHSFFPDGLRVISNESVHRYLEYKELQLARNEAKFARREAVKARKFSVGAIIVSVLAVALTFLQVLLPTRIKDTIKTSVQNPITIKQSQVKEIEEKLDGIQLKLEELQKIKETN